MTQSMFRLRDHVAFTDTSDGAVLLDERSGRYWQMNDSGCAVLRVLLEGGTTEDAARCLADRYQVTTERATHDVSVLVVALTKAGLAVSS